MHIYDKSFKHVRSMYNNFYHEGYDGLKRSVFLLLLFESCYLVRMYSQRRRSLTFLKIILVDTRPFVGPLIPCLELMVPSPPGFKARAGSLINAWQRSTWYTFPKIRLWCDTFAGVYAQHSTQSLSHMCVSA